MNITNHLLRLRSSVSAFGAMALLAGCAEPASDAVQGYVEGEFVYVAAPLPGALETLSVRRGGKVEAGAPLFALEHGAEDAARAQAAQHLEEARANLADVRKGKRPTEIESLEAQLGQSRIALALTEKEFTRQSGLAASGASSVQKLDEARSARDQNQQRVTQLEADLATAKLGAREDQIAAAEADVRMLEAALARADWELAQKQQNAPQSGLVFDTLYREGEWVAAGHPIIALLPPGNIKVRAFVSETRIGSLHAGDSASVRVDGVAEPFAGTISYISPQAEYTPPVIYSQESREKLVFRIEVVFDPDIAAKLHPGQPVDVQITP